MFMFIFVNYKFAFVGYFYFDFLRLHLRHFVFHGKFSLRHVRHIQSFSSSCAWSPIGGGRRSGGGGDGDGEDSDDNDDCDDNDDRDDCDDNDWGDVCDDDESTSVTHLNDVDDPLRDRGGVEEQLLLDVALRSTISNWFGCCFANSSYFRFGLRHTRRTCQPRRIAHNTVAKKDGKPSLSFPSPVPRTSKRFLGSQVSSRCCKMLTSMESTSASNPSQERGKKRAS